MGSRRVGSKTKRSVYQLESLISDGDNPLEGKLSINSEFDIEGDIEDHVIISVPSSMSHRSVEELLEKLSKEITSPVIITTNNIHFLRARKMTHKEAMQVSKRVQSQQDNDSDVDENGKDPMGREPAKVFGAR